MTAGGVNKNTEKKETPKKNEDDAKECGKNATYSSSSKKCVCDSGYKEDSSGNCEAEKTDSEPIETGSDTSLETP